MDPNPELVRNMILDSDFIEPISEDPDEDTDLPKKSPFLKGAVYDIAFLSNPFVVSIICEIMISPYYKNFFASPDVFGQKHLMKAMRHISFNPKFSTFLNTLAQKTHSPLCRSLFLPATAKKTCYTNIALPNFSTILPGTLVGSQLAYVFNGEKEFRSLVTLLTSDHYHEGHKVQKVIKSPNNKFENKKLLGALKKFTDVATSLANICEIKDVEHQIYKLSTLDNYPFMFSSIMPHILSYVQPTFSLALLTPFVMEDIMILSVQEEEDEDASEGKKGVQKHKAMKYNEMLQLLVNALFGKLSIMEYGFENNKVKRTAVPKIGKKEKSNPEFEEFCKSIIQKISDDINNTDAEVSRMTNLPKWFQSVWKTKSLNHPETDAHEKFFIEDAATTMIDFISKQSALIMLSTLRHQDTKGEKSTKGKNVLMERIDKIIPDLKNLIMDHLKKLQGLLTGQKNVANYSTLENQISNSVSKQTQKQDTSENLPDQRARTLSSAQRLGTLNSFFSTFNARSISRLLSSVLLSVKKEETTKELNYQQAMYSPTEATWCYLSEIVSTINFQPKTKGEKRIKLSLPDIVPKPYGYEKEGNDSEEDVSEEQEQFQDETSFLRKNRLEFGLNIIDACDSGINLSLLTYPGAKGVPEKANDIALNIRLAKIPKGNKFFNETSPDDNDLWRYLARSDAKVNGTRIYAKPLRIQEIKAIIDNYLSETKDIFQIYSNFIQPPIGLQEASKVPKVYQIRSKVFNKIFFSFNEIQNDIKEFTKVVNSIFFGQTKTNSDEEFKSKVTSLKKDLIRMQMYDAAEFLSKKKPLCMSFGWYLHMFAEHCIYTESKSVKEKNNSSSSSTSKKNVPNDSEVSHMFFLKHEEEELNNVESDSFEQFQGPVISCYNYSHPFKYFTFSGMYAYSFLVQIYQNPNPQNMLLEMFASNYSNTLDGNNPVGRSQRGGQSDYPPFDVRFFAQYFPDASSGIGEVYHGNVDQQTPEATEEEKDDTKSSTNQQKKIPVFTQKNFGDCNLISPSSGYLIRSNLSETIENELKFSDHYRLYNKTPAGKDRDALKKTVSTFMGEVSYDCIKYFLFLLPYRDAMTAQHLSINTMMEHRTTFKESRIFLENLIETNSTLSVWKTTLKVNRMFEFFRSFEEIKKKVSDEIPGQKSGATSSKSSTTKKSSKKPAKKQFGGKKHAMDLDGDLDMAQQSEEQTEADEDDRDDVDDDDGETSKSQKGKGKGKRNGNSGGTTKRGVGGKKSLGLSPFFCHVNNMGIGFANESSILSNYRYGLKYRFTSNGIDTFTRLLKRCQHAGSFDSMNTMDDLIVPVIKICMIGPNNVNKVTFPKQFLSTSNTSIRGSCTYLALPKHFVSERVFTIFQSLLEDHGQTRISHKMIGNVKPVHSFRGTSPLQKENDIKRRNSTKSINSKSEMSKGDDSDDENESIKDNNENVSLGKKKEGKQESKKTQEEPSAEIDFMDCDDDVGDIPFVKPKRRSTSRSPKSVDKSVDEEKSDSQQRKQKNKTNKSEEKGDNVDKKKSGQKTKEKSPPDTKTDKEKESKIKDGNKKLKSSKAKPVSEENSDDITDDKPTKRDSKSDVKSPKESDKDKKSIQKILPKKIQKESKKQSPAKKLDDENVEVEDQMSVDTEQDQQQQSKKSTDKQSKVQCFEYNTEISKAFKRRNITSTYLSSKIRGGTSLIKSYIDNTVFDGKSENSALKFYYNTAVPSRPQNFRKNQNGSTLSKIITKVDLKKSISMGNPFEVGDYNKSREIYHAANSRRKLGGSFYKNKGETIVPSGILSGESIEGQSTGKIPYFLNRYIFDFVSTIQSRKNDISFWWTMGKPKNNNDAFWNVQTQSLSPFVPIRLRSLSEIKSEIQSGDQVQETSSNGPKLSFKNSIQNIGTTIDGICDGIHNHCLKVYGLGKTYPYEGRDEDLELVQQSPSKTKKFISELFDAMCSSEIDENGIFKSKSPSFLSFVNEDNRTDDIFFDLMSNTTPKSIEISYKDTLISSSRLFKNFFMSHRMENFAGNLSADDLFCTAAACSVLASCIFNIDTEKFSGPPKSSDSTPSKSPSVRGLIVEKYLNILGGEKMGGLDVNDPSALAAQLQKNKKVPPQPTKVIWSEILKIDFVYSIPSGKSDQQSPEDEPQMYTGKFSTVLNFTVNGKDTETKKFYGTNYLKSSTLVFVLRLALIYRGYIAFLKEWNMLNPGIIDYINNDCNDSVMTSNPLETSEVQGHEKLFSGENEALQEMVAKILLEGDVEGLSLSKATFSGQTLDQTITHKEPERDQNVLQFHNPVQSEYTYILDAKDAIFALPISKKFERVTTSDLVNDAYDFDTIDDGDNVLGWEKETIRNWKARPSEIRHSIVCNSILNPQKNDVAKILIKSNLPMERMNAYINFQRSLTITSFVDKILKGGITKILKYSMCLEKGSTIDFEPTVQNIVTSSTKVLSPYVPVVSYHWIWLIRILGTVQNLIQVLFNIRTTSEVEDDSEEFQNEGQKNEKDQKKKSPSKDQKKSTSPNSKENQVPESAQITEEESKKQTKPKQIHVDIQKNAPKKNADAKEEESADSSDSSDSSTSESG